MWVLLLFMLEDGHMHTYVLNHFEDSFWAEDRCNIEKVRIMGEMVKAYPNDNQFKIECIYAAKKTI